MASCCFVRGDWIIVDHWLLDPAQSDTTPDLLRDSSDDFKFGRVYGKSLATGTGFLILPRRREEGVTLGASFDVRIVHWSLQMM
jgi:hypothetical protein